MEEFKKQFSKVDCCIFLADLNNSPVDLDFSNDISYSIWEWVKSNRIRIAQIKNYALYE